MIQTPAEHKWLTKLLGFDYEINYTPGRTNNVANALSRSQADPEAIFAAISVCQPTVLAQLQQFYADHEVGRALFSKFQHALADDTQFTIQMGILHFKGRLFIPSETNLRKVLFDEYHASPGGGHSGVKGTLTRLATAFSWPHMAKDIKNWVRECSICQMHKYSTQKPMGLLQPLPIPSRVWEDISMDFITHLPQVHGKSVIWVVVDRLSKFGHFIALPTSFSAASLTPVFMVEIHRLHGMPKTIVSDRDRVFVSKFWQELFKLSGTKLCFSSSYHPQSDGQTEVLNRILETYLRCFVSDNPKLWLQFLHLAEYWYNSTYQSAIRMSPFEVLYGRPPLTLKDYITGSTAVASLDETLARRRDLLQTVRRNLVQAQIRMRSQANSHRQDRIFKEGDWVLLKLQPYRQLSVRGAASPKLSKRFFGPFKVLHAIGKVAYELELPPEARIHNVFHVSKLKPFHGLPPTQAPVLPPSATSTQWELKPLKILGHRVLRTDKGDYSQLLIQWDGLSVDEATWEDKATFHNSFAVDNLEDKVGVDQGVMLLAQMRIQPNWW